VRDNGAERHARRADDLAAYALGALHPNDAARLEAHLATCELCQAELRSLRTAVDAIPTKLEQFEPPRRLRRRLMAAVRREARQQRPASVLSPILRSPMLRLGAVAALASAAGAVGYIVAGRDGASSTSVPVRATPAARNAGGQLIRIDDSATLQARHLPQLPDGDVYQVWIQAGERLRPSTLFVVDRRGVGSAAVTGQLAGADRLLVTREPQGGSRHPTSPPLLRAPLN
jgi:anti-sigma-K factor RskA